MEHIVFYSFKFVDCRFKSLGSLIIHFDLLFCVFTSWVAFIKENPQFKFMIIQVHDYQIIHSL